MNIECTQDAIVALDVELDYPARMELIRMLASSPHDGPTLLRIQTYQSHLGTQANMSVDHGLGVAVNVIGMAIKTTRQVPA